MTLLLHITAGSLALISGFVALYASKGASLHRKAGMVFVCTMLTMCLAGLLISAWRGVAPAVNIPAAVLTAYLVITALTTVRPPAAAPRWLDPALMIVAFKVGLSSLTFAVEAFASPDGKRNGMPAFPFVLFGVVGILAGLLDLRMIRAGGFRGLLRLRRHLWRMSFALFIAALSFFIGQAKVIPQPIRIFPLLALPVLAVLITMVYWLRRVRSSAAGVAPTTLPATPPHSHSYKAA
jgi:uncharacterized membrane protein